MHNTFLPSPEELLQKKRCMQEKIKIYTDLLARLAQQRVTKRYVIADGQIRSFYSDEYYAAINAIESVINAIKYDKD